MAGRTWYLATDLLEQWLHDLQGNRTQETSMLCTREDVPEEVRRGMSEHICVRCTNMPPYIILRTISVIRQPGSIKQTASQKAANSNRQRCHFVLLTAAQKPNNLQIQNPHRAMSPSYVSEGFCRTDALVFPKTHNKTDSKFRSELDYI